MMRVEQQRPLFINCLFCAKLVPMGNGKPPIWCGACKPRESDPKKAIVRKNICENVGGKLYDFDCPVNWDMISLSKRKSLIEIDHRDGNPFNNVLSNIDQPCKICHAIKTLDKHDHKKFKSIADGDTP